MATAEPPRDDLIRWIKQLEQRLAIVEQRSPLANTGMSVPGAGTTQVDGALNVAGNLGVTGAATIAGPATISGLTTVSGTNGIRSSNYVAGSAGWKFDGTSLEANTGVIGDGALANPVNPDRARATGSNYALGAAVWSVAASVLVTVPASRTGLVATCLGYTFTRNMNTTGGSNGTGGDITYAYVGLGGQASASVGWPLSGNGGFTGAFAGDVFNFAGLTPGSTLTLTMNVSAGYQAIPADTNTRCSVSAGLLWLR